MPERVPTVCTTIMTIGIIAVVLARNLNFGVVLEECRSVYQIHGYVTDEWIVMTGK